MSTCVNLEMGFKEDSQSQKVYKLSDFKRQEVLKMWRHKVANPDVSLPELSSDTYFDHDLELFKTTQRIFR